MPVYQLNAGGDPTNPLDYTQPTTPSCVLGTDEICTITANDDGSGHPDLTVALKDEMIRALNFRTPNPPTVDLRKA